MPVKMRRQCTIETCVSEPFYLQLAKFTHVKRSAFKRNTLNNLRLALHSREVMESLRKETHVEYGRTSRGALRIFRDQKTLDHTVATTSHLRSEGLEFRVLSTSEAVGVEPPLAPIANQLVGAIHYGTDETGNAYLFCVALAEYARKQGVEFRYRTEVSSLDTHAGGVAAVVCDKERLSADQ